MGLVMLPTLIDAEAALHAHTWQATLGDGHQRGPSKSVLPKQVDVGVAQVI